ncbi:MAG: PAS domain S-box protein, partial [Daejeonella sp.]|uniref:PAS domain-containing protein n=1 Tax=Daejeonella sp. TaxID=2805397 RepID=UPI003C732308
HYRSLIENGADVLVVLTTDGKFKYAAPSIHRVLGYSEKDALALDLFELLHPDDIKDLRTLFMKCVKNPGISIDGYEGRIKNKKDEWLWLEGIMTNMLLDPAINGIVFNFRDITERRLARLQLVRTQLLNKSILSSLDAHIAVVNGDGLIISVNKAWDDFSIANGAVPASLTSNGSNYFTVCENAAAKGNKLAAQVLKGLKAVLNKEVELFKLEYPCHSPLEKRWFVLNVTCLGGDETGIVVSHQNVTDRKLAEEKVLLNELMFRGLIENSADGMAILSPEGRPLYVSPTIKNILGYTEDEGMELNLLEMVHPEDAPILIGVMKNAMDNPGVAIKGGVTRMIHKDGNWRWMEGVITNMLHNPAIGGIVDNFRDITDRKMAEQKILHANRLYSFISHINQLIVRVKDDQTLFNDACRIAVEHGKFKMAWIGHLFPTDETIKLVACFGATPKQEEFFSNYRYEPGGPIAKVINGLDYATIANISAEVKTRLTEIAGEAGFKSVIVLP